VFFKLSYYTGCLSESEARYLALSAGSTWGDAILECKETKKSNNYVENFGVPPYKIYFRPGDQAPETCASLI